MNMWKAKLRRGFALFLALVMCVSLLQLTALAADGESTEPVDAADHVHHAEGWICKPYCGIPAHTHSSACYHVDDDEESARTPVTLPDEIPVEDGTSTEVDDNGNPYGPGEFITFPDPENPSTDDPSEDNTEPTEPNEGGESVTQPEEGGEPVTQPEEGGEPATQPEEGGEPATQPEEGGEPVTQPEEGGEPVTQPEESGEPAAQPEEGTHIDDTDPPMASSPTPLCGIEEHVHTDECAAREDGGWSGA